MPSNAMISRSDSPKSPRPRGRDVRLFTLTPLGFEACAWIEKNSIPLQDDEYAFTCVFCDKPIAECKCGTGQE